MTTALAHPPEEPELITGTEPEEPVIMAVELVPDAYVDQGGSHAIFYAFSVAESKLRAAGVSDRELLVNGSYSASYDTDLRAVRVEVVVRRSQP